MGVVPRDRDSLPRRRIGNVDIHVLRRSEAIAIILEKVERKEPQLVSYCNAHTVNLATHDKELTRILNSGLVLNDGVGVDIASRVLHGAAFPENLIGDDVIPAFLESVARPLRLFLIGSPPGVVERTSVALRQRYPHEVVGTLHGFFSIDEEETIAELVARANPDLILAGMGQPRQEIWADRYIDRFGCTIVCVGGLLDFIAGVVPRAPKWIRRCRMEWAYRLVHEPRRLGRRYLIGNATFLLRLGREYLIQRLSPHARR